MKDFYWGNFLMRFNNYEKGVKEMKHAKEYENRDFL